MLGLAAVGSLASGGDIGVLGVLLVHGVVACCSVERYLGLPFADSTPTNHDGLCLYV